MLKSLDIRIWLQEIHRACDNSRIPFLRPTVCQHAGQEIALGSLWTIRADH